MIGGEQAARTVYGLADRRKGGVRRVTISAAINDQRSEQDRRQSVDRRGNYENVIQDGERFLFDMCVWLNDQSSGAWYIGPNENEPAYSSVSCRVRFDEEADLEAFIAWVLEWERTSGES